MARPRTGFQQRADRENIRIGPDTFRMVEEWIDAAAAAGRNVQYGEDTLLMLMARVDQSFSMKMSAGPRDPQERRPDLAWKMPVRRITSRYYKGWRAGRVAPGVWAVWNTSREAYFIEYGINHVGQGTTVTYRDGRTYIKGSRRVRRPVRKLALIQTLKFLDQTRTGERVWEMIFAPFRPGRRYTGRGSLLISDRVQAMSGMRFI